MKLAIALALAFGCHSAQDHAHNTCEVALRKNAACFADFSIDEAKKMIDLLPGHIAMCMREPAEVAMFDKCLQVQDCHEFTICQTDNWPAGVSTLSDVALP